MEDMQEKEIYFAQEILAYGREELLKKMRYMAVPFSKLKPSRDLVGVLEGDRGEQLFFDAEQLIIGFAAERTHAMRLYLHMVFHCLFRHIFWQREEERLWFIAADMAVENAILALDLPETRTEKDFLEKRTLAKYKGLIQPFTAENIYAFLLQSGYTPHDLRRLEGIFARDVHYYHGESEETQNDDAGEMENELARQDAFDFFQTETKKEAWDEISQEVEVEIQNYAQEMGDAAGTMVQNLAALSERNNAYRQFLRRFTSLAEDTVIDEDSFDYIYYTYGLSLYDNLPLIEPLEYKEVRKIEEFVIALDTSGSCSGETVQAFLQETYDILMDREQFFKEVTIHIIQCDREIQEDTVIHSAEEFEDFIKNGELKGFGGTDFRPVFDYVEGLREKGELTHLKGLLYFTDGLGIYPTEVPDYETAFVFLSEQRFIEDPDFPPWALRVTVSANGLMEASGL